MRLLIYKLLTQGIIWLGLLRDKVQMGLWLETLDPGIMGAVKLLRDAGIETYESCEGGIGHAYPKPTVAFHGQHGEGFRALAVALQHRLPVSELRRAWSIESGEPVGPFWEMVFSSPVGANYLED